MKALPILGWKKSLEEIVILVTVPRPIPVLNDNAIPLSQLEKCSFVREIRRQRVLNLKEAEK